MKKIISGKVYDTDKAHLLGEWWNGLSIRDFHCVKEKLYQKRTGEFFLYGWGGPETKYVRRDGDGWCGGEAIIPLTVEDARRWAEKKLDTDEYEAIFTPADDDDTRERLTVTVSGTLMAKLRLAASEQGKSLTDMVEGILSENI